MPGMAGAAATAPALTASGSCQSFWVSWDGTRLQIRGTIGAARRADPALVLAFVAFFVALLAPRRVVATSSPSVDEMSSRGAPGAA